MFQHFCYYHFFLFKTALMIYCSKGKKSSPDCFQKTTQNRYFSIYKNIISRTLINNITTCMYFLKLQNYLTWEIQYVLRFFRLWFAYWGYVYLWPSLTSRSCHCQQELSCFISIIISNVSDIFFMNYYHFKWDDGTNIFFQQDFDVVFCWVSEIKIVLVLGKEFFLSVYVCIYKTLIL